MAKENVTIKIDESLLERMITYYKEYQEDNSGEYVAFFARFGANLTITIFSSNKGYKAFFSGEDALFEAKKWDENAEVITPKVKVKTEWKDLSSQIGSDEVGTGDFFGPVIVVASYIPSDMMDELKSLGIDDSKKITDEKILDIVPKFVNKVVFSRLICKPEKYNEMIDKGLSMNEIKAILHNQALTNVRKKIKSNDMKCYVDQFTSVDSYYRYLAFGGYKPLTNNITFETKGESHYPSVAVSSMIARYSFLKYFDDICNEYHVEFPKGASLKVDEVAKKIYDEYGIETINKLVKKNFVNYQKLSKNN